MKSRSHLSARGADLFETLETRQLLATFTVTSAGDSGDGSLRQAIADANAAAGADVIEFDAGLAYQTIALSSGRLGISDDLTINGLGPGQTFVSGSGASQVFYIGVNATVAINGLTVTGGKQSSGLGGGIYLDLGGTLSMDNSQVVGNSALWGGGIYNNDGTLTLKGCTISSNSATFSQGGGIYNFGSLTITNSTVTGNSAVETGGGIFHTNGTATLLNSTLSWNSAKSGGGITNWDTLVVTNSTISGNSATQSGGGVYNWYSRSLVVSNSTIAGNAAGSSGGGLATVGVNATLVSTIVAGNSGGDMSGSLDSGSGDNLIGGDPVLGPLADNGGPTQTRAVLAGSAAIGAGSNPLGLTTDQRGDPYARSRNGLVDIGAFQRHPRAQVVDTASDTDNGYYGAGDLSLREAINRAYADPEMFPSISFDPALNGQTITLSHGELQIRGDLTITGPGAKLLTISGNFVSRIFNVADGDSGSSIDVEISGLTLANGYSGAAHGGAVYSTENLTLRDSLVRDSHASSGWSGGGIYQSGVNAALMIIGSALRGSNAYDGGGVYVLYSSFLLDRSEVSGNYAFEDGGGVRLRYAAGATIRNSTISTNYAENWGGGLATYTSEDVRYEILNSTITANRADSNGSGGEMGGGIHINGGTALLHSTILDKNWRGAGSTADDINFFQGNELDPASSNNLVGDAATAGALDEAKGNIIGQSAMLAPGLAYFGVTGVHALLADSPAINTGSNTAGLSYDQRGGDLFARTFDGATDIGAYERQTVSLLVDSADTVDDGDYTPGHLALTEAIDLANNNLGDDTITIDRTSLSGVTITIPSTLNLSDDVTLIGPGSGRFTIDGGGSVRIFSSSNNSLTGSSSIRVQGLKLTNGYASEAGAWNNTADSLSLTDIALEHCTATSWRGGALYNWAGVTTITDSSFLENTAGEGGGAIFNLNGATLTLSNSTLSGNTARFGGGIANAGTLTVTRSTISDNSSMQNGGGIDSWGQSLTIDSSTISGNSAGNDDSGATYFGGGVQFAGGTASISSSTISGNSATFSNGWGGGIAMDGSNTVLQIDRCTISGNAAWGAGGGIVQCGGSGILTISGSTIAFNQADSAGGGSGVGGGVAYGALATLDGTIVSNNTRGTGGTPDDLSNYGGTIGGTSSHNLIGDTGTAGGLTDGANDNLVGHDPLLAPLADNGGRTQTHAIPGDSPALDRGTAVVATSDQRGLLFSRSFGARPDIGAYERQTLALVVDTTEGEDDGDVSPGDLSLREAIAASNGNPLDDTISFDAALNGSTIVLLTNAIVISDDVAITGPGSGKLTIDGHGNARIFTVTDRDDNTVIVVSISGLTLTNGSFTNGGAIDNLEDLSLTDVTLTGNHASNDGGAIHNTGSLTITNSTITDNTSHDAGGAIDNDGASRLTISGSTLENNVSEGHGGAIDNDAAGEVIISASTFRNNKAAQHGANGGAINNNGVLTISHTVFTGNQALGGDENMGGAIFNGANGTLTISNSRIANSFSVAAGGAIENRGAVTITDTTFADNWVYGGEGGAIDNFGGTLTVVSSLFRNNTAGGSGGAIWTDTTLVITNSTFSANSANGWGGAIGMYDGTVIISSSTLAYNITDADDDGQGQGGAIDVGKRSGAGTLKTISTIYAHNVRGSSSPVPNEITLTDGSLTSDSAYNLVADGATAGGLTNGVKGNLLGVDPKLGALGDNGGPTWTHGVYLGSPALDAGAAAGSLTTDQRGLPRNYGLGVDIGAFEWGPTAFSLAATSGAVVRGASDSSDNGLAVVRNSNGDLLVFSGSSTWEAIRLRDYTDAAPATGDALIWTDPNDGLIYVAGPSTAGFLLFVRAKDGSWSYRNLSTETGAASKTPVGTLTYFVTRPKTGSPRVMVAGVDAQGRIVSFQQTGQGSSGTWAWTFYDITTDLDSQGMTTPKLTKMISYVTSWNQWTLAGLDAAGNVQGVWVNIATFTTWRVDNLSTITGADPFTGELDVTLTSWGGIRFAGANTKGRLVATWWNPTLGGGNWKQTNLSQQVPGGVSELKGGQLTAWFTPSDVISYAGYSSSGDIITLFWQPGDRGVWSSSNLTSALSNRSSRPTGVITSHVSAAGTVGILGLASNRDVVRLWWKASGGAWSLTDLTTVAVRA